MKFQTVPAQKFLYQWFIRTTMLLSILLLSLGWLMCTSSPQKADLLIVNGTIVDGTGRLGFPANVSVRDGRIVAIGDLSDIDAAETIDAQGLIIAPGFIDLHTHAERRILDLPAVENYTRQGVTTVVGGNCGSSPHPLKSFVHSVDSTGIGPNLAMLVGHNTVRSAVMGTENRAPSVDEMERMREIVRQAMKAGAYGLSTGLKYVPGAYAEMDEVVELADVAVRSGGFYATHLREEGLGLVESVEEAIEIGRQTQIPVHISHHKVIGKSMWGASEKTLALIDGAAQDGMDITFDQYPYTATSTGITVLFPAWSLAGGQDSIKARLDDPVIREKIREGIMFNILNDRGGGDPSSVVVVSHRTDSTIAGLNLAEITVKRGRSLSVENAAETLMDLVAEGGGSGIYHCLSEEDVRRIMSHPSGTVGSDGGTVRYGRGLVHPRSYGTFPRVLGRYVKEGVLSMEEAIRKMTSLPARRLGLKNRGVIRQGAIADLVIFDPNTIMDNATFLEPHQYPSGVNYVMVKGVMVIRDGEYTGERPGEVLRRK